MRVACRPSCEVVTCTVEGNVQVYPSSSQVTDASGQLQVVAQENDRVSSLRMGSVMLLDRRRSPGVSMTVECKERVTLPFLATTPR